MIFFFRFLVVIFRTEIKVLLCPKDVMSKVNFNEHNKAESQHQSLAFYLSNVLIIESRINQDARAFFMRNERILLFCEREIFRFVVFLFFFWFFE